MINIAECPICGRKPSISKIQSISLDKNDRNVIYQRTVLEFAINLGKESNPEEVLSICLNCRTIFRKKFFDSSEIDTIYGGLYLNLEQEFSIEAGYIYNDDSYLCASSERMFEVVKNLAKIKSAKIEKVFDIGGRDGFRLKKLAIEGYDCKVFDPVETKPCTDIIKKEYIYASKMAKDEKADLIILCDVLEHCVEPYDVINNCHQHLNDEGYLYLEVPFDVQAFFDWYLFKRFRKKNISIDYTHFIFYSLRSLTYLLEKCGFRVVERKIITLPKTDILVIEVIARRDEITITNIKRTLSYDFDLLSSGYFRHLINKSIATLRKLRVHD